MHFVTEPQPKPPKFFLNASWRVLALSLLSYLGELLWSIQFSEPLEHFLKLAMSMAFYLDSYFLIMWKRLDS